MELVNLLYATITLGLETRVSHKLKCFTSYRSKIPENVSGPMESRNAQTTVGI